MAAKMKVTVSLDEALVRELAGLAGRGTSPGANSWMKHFDFGGDAQPGRALRDGYLAMAKEDRAVAERRMAAGWEAVLPTPNLRHRARDSSALEVALSKAARPKALPTAAASGRAER